MRQSPSAAPTNAAFSALEVTRASLSQVLEPDRTDLSDSDRRTAEKILSKLSTTDGPTDSLRVASLGLTEGERMFARQALERQETMARATENRDHPASTQLGHVLDAAKNEVDPNGDFRGISFKVFGVRIKVGFNNISW